MDYIDKAFIVCICSWLTMSTGLVLSLYIGFVQESVLLFLVLSFLVIYTVQSVSSSLLK